MSLGEALRHLRAGDWEQAHELVQDDESRLGCWTHGIVHVLEGDLANARYWYRRAGRPLPEPFDLEAELLAVDEAASSSGA